MQLLAWLQIKVQLIKDAKNGKMHEVEMWKYWFLQEGVLGVDADYLKTNEGKPPPVIHVDTDAPLYSWEFKVEHHLILFKNILMKLMLIHME